MLHAAPPDYSELDYTPFGARLPPAHTPAEAAATAAAANGDSSAADGAGGGDGGGGPVGHRGGDAPEGIGDSVAQASQRKLRRAFSGFYEGDLFPARPRNNLLNHLCMLRVKTSSGSPSSAETQS